MFEMLDVHVSYELVPALKGVTLEVKERESVSVLGPNGAGKTTTVRAIMGIVKPRSGRTLFNGQEITGLPPHRVVELGISLVPEGRLLFPQMSVEENLSLGACTSRARARYADSLEWVFSTFPRIKERRPQAAGTLSGGEQQMLAIGRALMSLPRLLILDEPSIGLAPVLVKDLFSRLRRLAETELSILLVEQNALEALKISQRAYVLELGEVVSMGSSSEFATSDIIRSYVGV